MDSELKEVARSSIAQRLSMLHEVVEMYNKLEEMLKTLDVPPMAYLDMLASTRNIATLLETECHAYADMITGENATASKYADACATPEELHLQALTMALGALGLTRPERLAQIMGQYQSDADVKIDMYVGNILFGRVLRKSQSLEEAEEKFGKELEKMIDTWKACNDAS